VPGPRPSATHAAITLAITMTIALLTACAPASPSPTPEPSPSPTASPVPVADIFAETMQDPGLSGTGELTGTVTGRSVNGTLTGSLAFDGASYQQSVSVRIASETSVSEVIVVSGDSYSRTNDGPWILSGTPAGSDSLQGIVGEVLDGLTDEGVEQVDGRTLHHLVPAEGTELDPSFFGIAAPETGTFSAEIDFYAEPDGTPAILSFTLSLTAPDPASSLEVTLNYALDLGPVDPIQAPDDVWLGFTSSRFSYSAAYPDSWDPVVENEEHDFYGGPGQEVQIYFYDTLSGDTINQWFSESEALLVERYGVAVEVSEPISVSGTEGRLYSMHVVTNGLDAYFMEAVVIVGDHAWDLDWYSLQGHEAADRELFDLFLSSFTGT